MYTELLNIIYTYVFNYKEPDKHFLEDVLDIAINKDNLREYIKEVSENPNLDTEILEVGDGLAISKLK